MTIVDCSGHDVYVLCLYVMEQGDFTSKNLGKKPS